MDSSISNTLSRESVYESMSMLSAAMEDAAGRLAENAKPEAISNEEIRKGDVILETYRVEDDAVHGGMGSVWRVHHRSWGMDLAMKRPQPQFFAEGSDRRKAEFIAECENWINLGLHPNIVSCYYVRDIGGVPTIFSEWMNGGSLKDAIRSRTLYTGSEKEVKARILDIAVQAARGLRYSHGSGLVHQDVKPGNILLTGDWDAKVADFGLARAKGRLNGGLAASAGYTPEYCPREQAEGAEAEVWMDTYAWALTVMEMYAGSCLWKTGAEAFGAVFEDMPDPEKLRFRMQPPAGLTELFRRTFCLSSYRDADPDELERELIRIYEQETGSRYPRPEEEAARETADALNNRALSFLDLHQEKAAGECWDAALALDREHAFSVFNRALSKWRAGEITETQAEELLLSVPDEKTREEFAEALRREGSGTLEFNLAGYREIPGLSITGVSDDHTAVCGFSVGEGKPSGPVRTQVVRIPDGKVLLSLDAEEVKTVSLSRDGRYVLLTGKYNPFSAEVYSVQNGKRIWKSKKLPSCSCFFSPDSEYVIAAETGRPVVHLISLRTGQECGTCEKGVFYGFGPDGRLLLARDYRMILAGPAEDPDREEEIYVGMEKPSLPIGDKIWHRLDNGQSIVTEIHGAARYGKAGTPPLCVYRPGQVGLARMAVPVNGGRELFGLFSCWDSSRKNNTGFKAFIWKTETGQQLERINPYDHWPAEWNAEGMAAWLRAWCGGDEKNAPVRYTAGPKAEYRLSVARSTQERLQAQERYDRLIRDARTAYGNGRTAEAFRLAEEAMAVPGYENASEALRARVDFGAGLARKGIRAVIPLDELVPERPAETGSRQYPNWLGTAMHNLEQHLLEHAGNDVYTEYSVDRMTVSFSKDGRFLLIETLLTEERDSPAQMDIEITQKYGAAVIRAEDGRTVFQSESLYYKDPWEEEIPHSVSLDSRGERLLNAAENLSLIHLSPEGNTAETVLAEGAFEYAGFMEDDRYVLCQDTDRTVLVLDTENGRVLARRPFPKAEYGDIVPVGDHCFGILHEGQNRLCWIDWEYEGEKGT